MSGELVKAGKGAQEVTEAPSRPMCLTCPFFVADAMAGDAPAPSHIGGECHEGPPKLFLFQAVMNQAQRIQRAAAEPQVGIVGQSAWPRTNGGNFCGAHPDFAEDEPEPEASAAS